MTLHGHRTAPHYPPARMGEPSGYRETLRDPVAARLWGAVGTSVVGDYVGLGALLLLAYERSGGRLLGPAALFAIQAVPALLSGALAGGWLDRLPRGRALAGLQVVGAVVLVVPVVVPGLVPVLAAAGGLGAVRVASVSVRSAIIAEAVPEDRRGDLLAVLATTDQAGQVIGYITGAAVAVAIGAGTALIADAATFVLSAVVITTIPLPAPTVRETRPPVWAGFSEILSQPVLRVLGPIVWVTATVSALPETMAAGATSGAPAWTPFVLAAAPAGQAVTMAVLGRRRDIERPSFQLTHLVAFALALGIAAFGRSPAWYLVGNLLVGAGTAWVLGPQTLFVRVAPPEHMAQITGTMVAVIIAGEGIGTFAFAALADATSVGAAYHAAGVLVLVVALVGWVLLSRIPQAGKLDRLTG